MSGKGDKARAFSVSQQQFASNWEKAFGKDEELREVTYDGERVGTLNTQTLREVQNDGMWQHSCTVDMSVVWIGKDETCDMCGAWEEDDVR
jgi:hypothetical protein